MLRIAFEELKLHRVQAETLLHNVASQRVLERNGFVRYGVAPDYLQIAGEWQDHAMYQVVRPIQRDGALGPGDRRTAALRAPRALPTLAG
jgi:ribosomal-protein-alanine N-acetyltransferase